MAKKTDKRQAKALAILAVLLQLCLSSNSQSTSQLAGIPMLETGWREWTDDSIPPLATFQYKPQEYSPGAMYTAVIEYPELVQIEGQTLERWGLEPADIPAWPELTVSAGTSRKEVTLDISFLPLVARDGKFFAIDSYKLVINRSGAARVQGTGASDSSNPAMRYAASSVLATGNWVKIGVKESGIYRISYRKLKSLGFQNPEKVRLFGYGGAQLPENGLEGLVDDLPQNALWRGNDYVLFYAQGPESLEWENGMLVHKLSSYSDMGYYFLTETDSVPAGSTAVMEEALSDSVFGTVVSSFPDCVFHESDEYSWFRSGRRLFESYDYANGNSRTYSLDTRGITGKDMYLTVAFSSNDASSNRLGVQVNGNMVGTLYIPMTGSQATAQLAENRFALNGVVCNDVTNVKLVHERTAGANGHLDYIRLNFERNIDLDGRNYQRINMKQAMENASFRVTGSGPNVQLWQLKRDGQAVILPDTLMQSAQGDTTLTYACSVQKDDIILVVNVLADFPEPEYAGAVQNQNLHASAPADMVIVVPESGRLTTQAGRLAQAHRDIDGITVQVVNAGQIYNEFSSGTPDATAIRRFMKMFYDRADSIAQAPRYLLLMGGGAWDNRMHVSDFKGCSPKDYLLCYESDNSLSHTESFVMEDYFGLLDDGEGVNLLTEKTDLGVGRLPVVTEQQARQVVDKIVAYMNGSNAGKWQNEILVLGDDGDDNTHMEDADAVATLLAARNPYKRIKKMYWDSYPMEVSASYNSYPTLRSELLEKLDEGVLMVNYSGHGSMDVLSHELVLTKADALSLESDRLAFWFLASCDIAPFDQPLENFGCNLLLNPNGGAVGLVSTTRTVYSSLNRHINRSFSSHVLERDAEGGQNTLGDALRLAKNDLVGGGQYSDNSQNKLHYVLLGDPALKLRNSQYECVVDSFAHRPAGDSGLAAGAGAVVAVSGHIELDGKPVTGFNGSLYSTVYDSESVIECYNNLQTATDKFQYTDRDKVLAAGVDSVRNGRFSFTFPVPLDINYSAGQGLVSLFAVTADSKGSAEGLFSDFTLGGTDTVAVTDSIGPSISVYLNSPQFQYGGKVNSRPTLVAHISDESGVNAWGNGLGHDILLVIDGKRTMSWTLNRYYEPDNGDWTSGRILFQIPEDIAAGRHLLTLRAWDNMNNSRTVQLEFEVVEGLSPEVGIDVTESPASECTEFIISHDRPMQDAVLEIQVYDSRGVQQWSGQYTDNGRSGVSYVTWDLCSSGGHRLPAGLYIVRAIVRDRDSQRSAQCKLVIAAP